LTYQKEIPMDGDERLAQRIETQQAQEEAATADILRHHFSVPSAHARPFLGGYAVRMGVGYPTNRGMGVGFQPTIQPSEWEDFEAFYAAVGLPAELELCPFTHPSFLTLVAQRGYTVFRFYNVYVLSLSSSERSDSRSPTIDIHQATEAESALWAQTVAGTTQPEDPRVRLAQATFSRPGVRCYLATIQGKVAGGAALSLTNGIGMLSFMATVPAFRRQGVQHALIAERLAVAAAHGCELALCSTNPGNQSQRNVQRHGFGLAYTKVFVRKRMG
jgi:GNAT superfamily N-acetyltransferase